MKCPKCGYNSFDHLDSCKKCGKGLVEHKQRFGIVSVLFPGQMKPTGAVAVAEEKSVTAEAAVAAAAVATAATVGAETADFDVAEAAPSTTSEADDFGFDFMGDSEEEEDLSFDELFDEAPADEDVEETLPSPEEQGSAADEAGESDFAFDLDGDEQTDEADAAAPDLEDDFGFDPMDADAGEETEASAESLEDDLAEEDFEPPPVEGDEKEDEFSFETDNVEFEVEEEVSGAEEDPENPFDLPESSQQEKAPEQDPALLVVDSEAPSAAVVEDEPASEEELEPVVAKEGASLDVATITEPQADIFPEPEVLEVAEPSTPQVADEQPAESLTTAILTGSAPISQDAVPFPAEPSAVTDAPITDEAVSELFEEEPVGEPVLQPATDSEGEVAEDLPAAGKTESPDSLADDAVESSPAEDQIEGSDVGFVPATGSRIAAFCCDLILLLVVGTSFLIAAETAMSSGGASLIPSLETLIDLSVPYFLVLFSLAFGYFTLFHFLAGQTPGKMLTGLRVETVSGEPLHFSQAFLRSVGGLLQLLPIGLGYLIVLFSPERRGWNDRLAGTRLISLKGLSE
jgi:uncharacterized RDD family membrane protein YckC